MVKTSSFRESGEFGGPARSCGPRPMRSVLIGAGAVGRRSKFESGKCLAVTLPALIPAAPAVSNAACGVR